jgi:hypothetical protein
MKSFGHLGGGSHGDIAGQSGIINPDASCPCADIIAVEASSWGKIKALYKD